MNTLLNNLAMDPFFPEFFFECHVPLENLTV